MSDSRRTTVISVRGKDRDALLADPNFLYVGRACRGWKASDWGNPFMVSRHANAAELFERHLRKGTGCVLVRYQSRMGMHEVDFGTLRDRLPELRGKTLGCWCCDYDGDGEPFKPCHAVAIARMVNALPIEAEATP